MDRRIKYTKKIIRETFLAELKEKEINKITVSEICDKADINRATFYRYYLDIYDLLDKIEQEFLDELKRVTEEKSYSAVGVFCDEILEVFIANKDLIKIIFKTQNSFLFLSDFMEVVYDKCIENWKERVPDLSDEKASYSAIFIFNGALGIINYWVQNDFKEDTKTISKMIEKLSNTGISEVIYRKNSI